MPRTAASPSRLLLLLFLATGSLAPVNIAAQRERQVSSDQSEEKFITQLQSLFGRFREADLRRSFETARPIQCSELTSDTGEWRPVAFFNEDRKLGDWHYQTIDEVKAELSVFIFKGDCSTSESSVKLVTKFPVRDSLDRYVAGRVKLREVDVNVNAAVTASFNSRSQSYRFELPYMYSARSERTSEMVYTLLAPHLGDRYATNVTNHWDCKSVRASDVTFQFLICETATLPRETTRGNEGRQTFGTYAYFILSDGKEAMTSIKLSFGGSGNSDNAPPAKEAEPAPDRVSNAGAGAAGTRNVWQVPGPDTKLVEVGRSEFRLRFNSQTWANKISSAQILSDQKMSSLDPARLPAGVDYCAWVPVGASLVSRLMTNEPDTDVDYALSTGSRLGAGSISFEMKTHTGSNIGTLQCAFTGTVSADAISVDRWISVVGGHLTLEVNP